MQEWLSRAARELDLKVEFDHEVTLPDGRTLVAQAYFPDLGAPRGIAVFEWSDNVDAEARRSLEAMQIGESTFGAPGPNAAFDIDNYKVMFCDWGWTGPDTKKPSWMD